MKLLDLFCGAGGAAMGYYRVGFTDITGIDNQPMPRYPFKFIQADALEYLAEHGQEYDVIHASPPCQFGSIETPPAYKEKHPNLIPVTRELLLKTGKPFVIENVPGVRRHLINPIMLCGSMFGLGVWRHRYFELNPTLMILTLTCNHGNVPVLITGSPRRNGSRKEPNTQARKEAMDIYWMTRDELDQAIPPAYTEFIGRQLMARAAIMPALSTTELREEECQASEQIITSAQ